MKDSLTKLEAYLVAIREHWDRPHYVTLSVLVQNMAHRGEVINKAYNCVRAMLEMYPLDHVVAHVVDELDSIMYCEEMSNELEATMMDCEGLDEEVH